jgi:hypothetical protein
VRHEFNKAVDPDPAHHALPVSTTAPGRLFFVSVSATGPAPSGKRRAKNQPFSLVLT